MSEDLKKGKGKIEKPNPAIKEGGEKGKRVTLEMATKKVEKIPQPESIKPKNPVKEQKIEKKEKITMTMDKVKEKKKMIGAIRNEVVTDVKEIQKIVKEAIDQGAVSIEQVHQAIAKLPLKYLGKINKIKNATDNLGGIQEKTIGHVWNLIKTVNDNAYDISKDMLDMARAK
jgi:hypothetical protein